MCLVRGDILCKILLYKSDRNSILNAHPLPTLSGARVHARRRRSGECDGHVLHRGNGAGHAGARQSGGVRRVVGDTELAATAPAERRHHQVHGVHSHTGQGAGGEDRQGEFGDRFFRPSRKYY